jgi:hypothetical protein
MECDARHYLRRRNFEVVREYQSIGLPAAVVHVVKIWAQPNKRGTL